MMEAQIILAMVAQRCRLILDPTHTVEMEPIITLRPKHGIRVRAARNAVV
jgi:cytochrome P450